MDNAMMGAPAPEGELSIEVLDARLKIIEAMLGLGAEQPGQMPTSPPAQLTAGMGMGGGPTGPFTKRRMPPPPPAFGR